MRVRRSTAFELALAVAVVLAVVLAAYAWLVIDRMTREVVAVAERDASHSISFVERNLRLAMMRDHRDDVREVITELMREPTVLDVRIIDHEGRVKVAGDPAREGRLAGPDARACAACHAVHPPRREPASSTFLEEDRIEATRAIRADEGCIDGSCHADRATGDVLGILAVTQSVGETFRGIERSKHTLVAASVAAVILAFLLVGLVIAGRLHKPMNRLMEGTARIASGDLEHTMTVDREDELGALAREFNEMGRRLAASKERLVQSERLASMGKLAAGVAHELNNPLTGVLAFAEDLIADSGPEDPRREDYEVIRREALRCRAIVRDLLDFARQEKPSTRAEDVDRMVRRTLRLVTKHALFRKVDVCYEERRNLPLVRVDEAQIQQVLLNLLVNAADAMGGSGRVTITSDVVEDGRFVRVAVADEGPGIPEQIRDQIFEPFFSTKPRRSNGLGLSICRGIVGQHGGRLEFETAEGQGTTFFILLPVERRGRGKARAS